MEKIYTAIGNFYNEDPSTLIDVPDDEQEIYATIEKIMETCPAGTELTNEQIQIIRAYLPAVGCDEATQDDADNENRPCGGALREWTRPQR